MPTSSKESPAYPANVTSLMTWLVPAAGPERDELVATIGRFAARQGSAAFPPHVTLVPNIESHEASAEEDLMSSVTSTTPIDLTFDSLEHEPTYFRALYLVPRPSEALVALHLAIHDLWSFDPWQFEPHLSLLYSDMDEEHKLLLIDAIGTELPLTIRFDAIELWAASARVAEWYRIPLTA